MNTHTPKIDEILPLKITNIPSNQNIIKVIGVGGGGCNAVEHMFKNGIESVDFIIANTDKQVLEKSAIPIKIQLGKTLTQGLGAGNNPEQGKNAAIESQNEIIEILKENTKMVFITAGMGGGTGTGAAPIIAKIAKELGILTIAVVTIPFRYEGQKRLDQAKNGLRELKENVDALIIIDNEKINQIYGDLDYQTAFNKADDILLIAVKGIAEIITKKGYINVDFADVDSVLRNSGVALMGTAIGVGANRAEEAAKNAITSPLLNNNDIRGAKNILAHFFTPTKNKITNNEIFTINTYLQNKAGNNANLIWGVTEDESLDENSLQVTVIVSNFKDNILDSFDLKPQIKNLQNPPDKKELENNQYDIVQLIRSYDAKDFDYTNEDIINEYENIPAFQRQNIILTTKTINKLKNKTEDSPNSFINPKLD